MEDSVSFFQSKLEPVEEAPTEETPEAVEGESAEVETPAGEEVETEEVETEGAPEESETLELSQIAEILKIDESLLEVNEEGELQFKTNIDGEKSSAKLAEIIKSYQLEGHLNKQNMEVVELKKALQEERTAMTSQAQSRVTELEALAETVIKEFLNDIESQNLDQLKEDDPAMYAVRQLENQQRRQRLATIYQQVLDQKNRVSQESSLTVQARKHDEGKKLLDKIPEWRDSAVRDKEDEAIYKYAESLGFSDQEITSIDDHRAIIVMRDAMKYRQLMSQKPSIQNKVNKAPRIAKPGSKTSVNQGEAKAKQVLSTLKKTGGKNSLDYFLGKV